MTETLEFLVNVGSRQYGGRGFFTPEEFRNDKLEELARIGREGKGMYTTLQSNVPTANVSSELKSLNATSSPAQQSQLYKEFLEFQKFKQSQQQQPTKEKK